MDKLELKDFGKFYSLEGYVECKKCKGTGLYQGLAERDGAFVICWGCDGTGKMKISEQYNKFKGRKLEKGCKRVYITGMNYVISDKDITNASGRHFAFSKYGCSYDDWLKGVDPKHLEFLGCPYMVQNSLHEKDVNNLYKTRCHKNSGFGMKINCKLFHEKEKCWEIFNGK